MDPVPLLLSEISAFGYAHVNEKVEVNEIKRKHNVENYIRVSIGGQEFVFLDGLVSTIGGNKLIRYYADGRT